MAETIKGINVVIGAETTGLSKALSDVNKKARDIQSELRQVERLLKVDPKNTELLAQKQKLLGDAIANTREKLERLRAVQEQVNEQFQRGEISEAQYRAFQREVVKTEQELKKLEERLKSMEPAVKSLGERMQEAGDKLKKVGERMTDIGKNLSTKVTAPLAGLGAVIAKTGMDFEAAMSEVAAISGATGDDLAALEAKAKEMGATTKFSASEAAEALKYMAMAGWSTQQMLDGLPGVLNLAAASGEELGTVSDIVTDALTAFGMQAADAAQFADILAAASSNANTNVGMMGETFKYVAPVFGSLGYTAEDAALAIGLMANAGIKASQAGTALRGAVTRMVKPTGDAAELMEQLGIKLTDTQGNMLPFRDVMDQLRASFSKLTAEQQAQYASTIFGREAMSGMLAIINASEEDYQKLAAAIDNSTGAAEKMAKQMQDNLKGRLTELKSAIEGVALQLYEHMKPALESIVAAVKQVVDWFAKLPSGVQQVIVIIAALVAVIGPLLLALGMFAASLGSIISFIGTLGPAIAGIAGPVGIAIAAIALLATAAYLIIENWEPIKEFFSNLWESTKNVFSAAWEWIKGFFAEWGPTILAIIAPVIGIPLLIYQHWEEIKKFFVEIWDSIVTFLSNTWENIKNMAKNAFESILNVIKPILDGYKTFFSGIWDAIKNIFAGALLLIIDLVTGDFKNLKKDAEAIWNNLKDAFGRIWEGIKQVFSESLNLIKQILATTWNNIKTTAETAWNQFKTTVSNIIRTTVNWIKNTWDNLLAWFRRLPGTLYTIGSDMFNRMREAVVTTVKNVKDAIIKGITEAIDWIKTLPSQLKQLGKDMIQGLIDGIKSMVGKVGDAVKSIADKVTDGLRDFLKISSPSRVMMKLGEDTGEGFIRGLERKITSIRREAAEMAAAITGAFGGLSAPRASAAAVGGGGVTNINLEGLFNGATIVVRNDDDIRQLAREIWSMTQQAQRGLGGVRG